MLRCEIKLKIYDPNAPLLPPGEALLGELIPPAADTRNSGAFGPRVFVPKDRGADSPDPLVASAALRQPIRDRVRANLIRTVVSRSAAPVTEYQVEEALMDLEGRRPLLDWLANGGLEKLITLLLDLLKLAA